MLQLASSWRSSSISFSCLCAFCCCSYRYCPSSCRFSLSLLRNKCKSTHGINISCPLLFVLILLHSLRLCLSISEPSWVFQPVFSGKVQTCGVFPLANGSQHLSFPSVHSITLNVFEPSWVFFQPAMALLFLDKQNI